MVTFWDLAIAFIIIVVFFAILYSLGKGERKGKKREALLPFVSGEKYHPMRVPYRIKWIYYVSLFTAFETAGLLVLLAFGAGVLIVLPLIYILIILLALLLAPKE
ncbi:MAG: hypothetical protein ACTSX9_08105 [Candidatus Njordarchaeales archaeon]